MHTLITATATTSEGKPNQEKKAKKRKTKKLENNDSNHPNINWDYLIGHKQKQFKNEIK